jgi:hypothetical protein
LAPGLVVRRTRRRVLRENRGSNKNNSKDATQSTKPIFFRHSPASLSLLPSSLHLASFSLVVPTLVTLSTPLKQPSPLHDALHLPPRPRRPRRQRHRPVWLRSLLLHHRQRRPLLLPRYVPLARLTVFFLITKHSSRQRVLLQTLPSAWRPPSSLPVPTTTLCGCPLIPCCSSHLLTILNRSSVSIGQPGRRTRPDRYHRLPGGD